MAMFSHISHRDVEGSWNAWSQRPWQSVQGIKSEDEAVFTVTRSVNCWQTPVSGHKCWKQTQHRDHCWGEGKGGQRGGLWRSGPSLTSLHMGRGWALWMPDLKRVVLAKVMKYCRRITGTRITFMGRGERERERGMQGRSIHLRRVRRTEAL